MRLLVTKDLGPQKLAAQTTVDQLAEGVAGGVGQVREQHDLARARGQGGPAHLRRHGGRVTATAQPGRGVDDVHLDLAADQRVHARDGDRRAVRGLPQRVALVGEAGAGRLCVAFGAGGVHSRRAVGVAGRGGAGGGAGADVLDGDRRLRAGFDTGRAVLV